MPLERIIWFAMFLSTVIYAVIAFMLGQRNASRPFEEAVHDQFVLILYGLTLVDFLIAFLGVATRPDQPRRVRMIINLGLYESCAVYGLVLTFLHADWRLYLAPWALTLVGFLRVFPTSEPD